MKSASDIAYSRITPEETVRLKEALGAKDFWAIPSVSFTAERKLLQEVIKYTAVNLSIQGTNEVDRGKDIDRIVSDIYENIKSGFLANQHTAIQKQIALLETDVENHLRDLQANPREVDIQGYCSPCLVFLCSNTETPSLLGVQAHDDLHQGNAVTIMRGGTAASQPPADGFPRHAGGAEPDNAPIHFVIEEENPLDGFFHAADGSSGRWSQPHRQFVGLQ